MPRKACIKNTMLVSTEVQKQQKVTTKKKMKKELIINYTDTEFAFMVIFTASLNWVVTSLWSRLVDGVLLGIFPHNIVCVIFNLKID